VSAGRPTRLGGLRLWTKLAAFAVLGVVAMHAVHLVVGNRIAIRALERDQAQLGGGVARLVAGEAADPILLHDSITLSEIVARAAAIPGVAYCFVVRDGAVLASSFRGSTPAVLLDARDPSKSGPLVIVDATGRFRIWRSPSSAARRATSGSGSTWRSCSRRAGRSPCLSGSSRSRSSSRA
jgi:hypothetical protein